MIEVNYIPGLPEIPFRNGVGKSEGHVMHATAVYGDTALGERNYECTHYPDAFVHGFSDPHSTLEVANPNYIAYGAGHEANLRFTHGELCQVKNDYTGESLALFKASYANWIEYAAQKLFDQKVGVTPAQPDGSGTLWQHYQVSLYLGDSTHVDPMDYLQTWSVTWDQVVADVQNKYKELEQMEDILNRLAALEELTKVLVKKPAPDWFLTEFGGTEVLTGIVHDLTGDEDFWRNTAEILREFKAKGL